MTGHFGAKCFIRPEELIQTQGSKVRYDVLPYCIFDENTMAWGDLATFSYQSICMLWMTAAIPHDGSPS